MAGAKSSSPQSSKNGRGPGLRERSHRTKSNQSVPLCVSHDTKGPCPGRSSPGRHLCGWCGCGDSGNDKPGFGATPDRRTMGATATLLMTPPRDLTAGLRTHATDARTLWPCAKMSPYRPCSPSMWPHRCRGSWLAANRRADSAPPVWSCSQSSPAGLLHS